jgi:hypothetical protein
MGSHCSLSVCLCILPNFILVFYAVSILSKENKRLVLPRTSYIYLLPGPILLREEHRFREFENKLLREIFWT